VIKFCRLQNKLVGLRDKCVELKWFGTPPNINSIDFNELWDELTYKKQSCAKYMLISTDNFICTHISNIFFLLISYIVFLL